MKKLFKEHSPYLLILSLFEILFTIITIFAFSNSENSVITWLNDINLLVSNLYTQTWWGLVILLIGLITIFKITGIVYKKLEYIFISILAWSLLFIIALANPNGYDILSILLLYIPIIIINILAYRKEKQKLENKKKK